MIALWLIGEGYQTLPYIQPGRFADTPAKP